MDKLPTLAKEGDPLVAADGEILEPDGHIDTEDLPAPRTPTPFKYYRPTTRKVLSDFRAPDTVLNVASVVFVYTVLGISDAEIGNATGLSSEDINKARETRAYSDLFEGVMTELISANSEYIEARIAAYAPMALNNVAHIAKHAQNHAVKLSASKDILDRSGHRPQDTQGRAQQGMNELHIVITKSKDAPDTDIEFKLNQGE